MSGPPDEREPTTRPPADPRFARLPRALEERRVVTRLGPGASVPAFLAHPDEGWAEPGASPTPRPCVLWMHGRTMRKEIDPGRFLRWQRAGIATCSIDLAGHGERADPALDTGVRTLDIVERTLADVDGVVESLADPRFNGAFDADRLAIGGMSAGGMVTLCRLCEAHPFKAAAVEATAGDFGAMGAHPAFGNDRAARLDPVRRLDGWRPIPLLALHAERDEWVPLRAIESFVAALRERYAGAGADPDSVVLKTWPETGAEGEHIGFGRVSNDAKNTQTAFLADRLGAEAPERR